MGRGERECGASPRLGTCPQGQDTVCCVGPDEEWEGEFCGPAAERVGSDGYEHCDAGRDACEKACCRLTVCATGPLCCPGYSEPEGDGLFESCLDTCAAQPALGIVINGQSSCDATVNFAAGSSPDAFAPACLGEDE